MVVVQGNISKVLTVPYHSEDAVSWRLGGSSVTVRDSLNCGFNCFSVVPVVIQEPVDLVFTESLELGRKWIVCY